MPQEENILYKNKYRIPSARYKGYDYRSDGFYFVTICTKNRELFFGDIKNEKIFLSEIGKIAKKYLLEIPKHFPFAKIDYYSIMPNHIHLIIQIENNNRRDVAMPNRRRDVAVLRFYDYVGNHPKMSEISPKPKSLPAIIRSFKSISNRTINQKFPNINFAWQSRFHDRIIRNLDELNRIRQYIIDNPIKWELDRNNPKNI
jgi:REP element-mobilizing transposase RayT